MRILGQTGGATQFIELVQASIEVKKVFDFTDLVVTSASAIASLPFVIGMYEELIEEGENLEVKDFMKVSPTNSKGGFSWRAIFRAIRSFLPFTKVNSFGVQDVSKLLKKYVTPEVFQQYKEGNYPNIHVYYVDPDTKTPCIENAKNCTYQEFIDLVQTSSKIQPMVEHGIFRDKPKGLVKIEIKVLNNDKGETITFYTGVLRNEFDLSMDSVNGSMLTVSIDTMNESYEIDELWIALIWTPHVGNTTIKKFLVEELIKEIEDEGV